MYLNLLIPKTPIQFSELPDGDTIILLLKKEEPCSSPHITFFSEEMECVTIPIINRGDSKRTLVTLYLTQPLKVYEFVSVMLKNLKQKLNTKRRLSLQSEAETPIDDSLNDQFRPVVEDMHYKSALIVDDNSINRKVLERILKIIGVEHIDQASDGLEAVHKFKSNPSHYDIILMDLLMPNMTGKDACGCIRGIEKTQHLPKCKIVAITANIWETRQSLIEDYHFDAVLYKPILIDSLRQVLSQ